MVNAAQVLGKSSSHQGTPEHPCIWAGDGRVFRGEGAADVNAMPKEGVPAGSSSASAPSARLGGLLAVPV